MADKVKSLVQRVRDVLKGQSEPLKAGEIRELLADDAITSERLGTTLLQLCNQGELEKEGDRGAYRYHLVPTQKVAPKDGGSPTPAPAPERRRARPHLPVATPPKARNEAIDAQVHATAGADLLDKLIDLVPGARDADEICTGTVMLPRRTVRLLVAGLLVQGGNLGPYQEAIAEAIRESA